jgi:uncharacterized membrane protein YbhN (UPF0104 family)
LSPCTTPLEGSIAGPTERLWTRVAGLGLGVVAGAWVLRSLSKSGAPWQLTSVGPGVALAFFPFLLTMSFDTLGWRSLLRAAGANAPFLGLLRIRLAAEAVGVVLPSAGLVQEIVAFRALLTRHGVCVTQGLASLAARRFALVQAHGIVLGIGALLLFGSALASVGSRALCLGLLVASLALAGVGHLGPRWLLMPSLADRALRPLDWLPGRRIRDWADRHRHELAGSGRMLAKISGSRDATAALAFVLVFFSEAFESFVMLRLLGSRLDFAQVLSFDSAVGLARSLVAFVPAGLGVQEAGYTTFLLGAGGANAAGLVASFVVLKRVKEALYCVLGLTLGACRPRPSEGGLDEPVSARALRLRLAQPDHPDA